MTIIKYYNIYAINKKYTINIYFHSNMQNKNGILESMFHETSMFQIKIFINEVYKNMHLYINSDFSIE